MKQIILSESGFKRTRKREFLDAMSLVVPWAELNPLIAPHAPQSGAKVEHPFRVIMRRFGYVKVKYRWLTKKKMNLMTLFALSNIWMIHNQLFNIRVQGRLGKQTTQGPEAEAKLPRNHFP